VRRKSEPGFLKNPEPLIHGIPIANTPEDLEMWYQSNLRRLGRLNPTDKDEFKETTRTSRIPALRRRFNADSNQLLAGSFQDAVLAILIPVVSLPLNHQVMAGMPPASDVCQLETKFAE
jgi:hypothetical protein